MARKPASQSIVDDDDPPNTSLLGGRFKAERLRLRLSRAELAQAIGWYPTRIAEVEDNVSEESSGPLTRFAHIGADVLYIMTGQRNAVADPDGRLPTDRFRAALESLCANDRQRLLLHFTAEELRWNRKA